jgi:hypothetical protein
MNAQLLLRLPVELHLRIIDNLELQDMVTVAAANRYLRSIIEPPSHHDCLAAEGTEWAKKKRLYTCRCCTRSRHVGEFADDITKSKRIRGGAEAHARICLTCGINSTFYAPGVHTIIYGKPHLLCCICGLWSDETGSQSDCARCIPLPLKYRDHHEKFDAASSRSAYNEEPYGVWQGF